MGWNSSSHVKEKNRGIEALHMGYLQRVFTDRRVFDQGLYYGMSCALHMVGALYDLAEAKIPI
jgi:hypothetical protein